MAFPTNLHALNADALRQLLIVQDRELTWRQAKIDQLTNELSLHKRWHFGVKPERLPVEQAGVGWLDGHLPESTAPLLDVSWILDDATPRSVASHDKNEVGQAKPMPLRCFT